jgi:ABC transport system ATP-binding/permease protein
MMVLSGAMFPFDKLNRKIGNVDKVPLIAELMPTRWTYEALIVSQFKDNKYSKQEYTKEKVTKFQIEKKISAAEFNKVYRLKALREALETTLFEYRRNPANTGTNEDILLKSPAKQYSKLQLLKNELDKMHSSGNVPEFNYLSDLTPNEFNPVIADSLSKYLDRIYKTFSKISNSASDIRDRFYNMNDIYLKKLENDYYNYKLLEIVTKPYERKKILYYNNTLVQNTDPIYFDPDKKGFFNFRTHFYSPAKYIFGVKTDTFIFNISLVLLSTVLLYLALYFEILKKAVRFLENFKLRK